MDSILGQEKANYSFIGPGIQPQAREIRQDLDPYT